VQNATLQEFESIVHLPTANPSGPKNDIACRVVTVKGHRMHLQSPEPIPACVPLSVEHDDALYLGEVVFCLALDCVYEVDIDVEQVLTGLQGLISLRARLLDEQTAALRDAPPARLKMLNRPFGQS
jgi:hypothetical protein